MSASRRADVISAWRGDRPAHRHWSDQLLEGREGESAWRTIAEDPTAPDWVQGSAWARLAREPRLAVDPANLAAGIRRAGPLARLGLVALARRFDPATRASLLRPLLRDSRRAVRVAAAEALADVPTTGWRPADRSSLGAALGEYREAQEATAERPEAQVNLGMLAARYGDVEAARAAFTRAIERADYFVPAHVNLADLERAIGNESKALDHLRDALAIRPEDGMVRYALGLALHRSGDAEGALAELARASADAPLDPRAALGHALALDGAGRRAEAIDVLEQAAQRGIADADIHEALVAFLSAEGERERALLHAEAWQRAYPGDARARAAMESLRVEAIDRRGVRPGPTD